MSSKEPRPLPKHTPGPWVVKDVPGAGLEIHAQVHLAECVEYPRKPTGPVMIFTCVEQPAPFLIACERWVQFEPKGWHAMQAANAELIALAPELLARVEELEKLCTIDGIEDLIETRDRLTADNARLRELLRECYQFFADYQVGVLHWPVTNARWLDMLDRIKAAIEKGE